jgi:hypothetical protein
MLLVALGLLLAVHLGPETPIGTHDSGAAAAFQYAPSAAWNGRTGLAVWTDERGTYPADAYPPRVYGARMLRVSPMRADGSLTIPGGTPLFPAWKARIASNGSSFLLAYRTDTETHIVPLDESGHPDGTDTLVSRDYYFDFDLASNGRTFLFVSPAGVHSIHAIVFQPSGVPYAATTFDTGLYAPTAPAATAIGDIYAVAYRAGDIHLAVLAENAATTDNMIVSAEEADGNISLAASDDRLLVALVGNRSVRTLIAGRDAKAITPLKLQAQPDNYADRAEAAFWDGQSFLVAWHGANLEAMRVSRDNEPLDATPVVLGPEYPSQISFTRTSEGIVALWSSNGDVLRRDFASNAELFTRPAEVTPEVLSVHAQSQPSLAQFGSAPLRVWREGSFDAHVMLSLNGRTIDVASSTERELRDPSVARGGNAVLVFWRDVVKSDYLALGTTGYRTYARRFALDGTALDAQPILVYDDPAPFVEGVLRTATAFDGRNFVVIWSGPRMRAARISPNGTLLDSTPLAIESPAEIGINSGMRAVWTGSELLVAWASWNDYRNLLISPRPPARSAALIARLDTRGVTMKVNDVRTVWQGPGLSKSIDLAWNGTHALLASVHSGCAEATLLDATLEPLASAQGECVKNSPPVLDPAVAWNGGEFVLAWSSDTVHAMRFDASLQKLDATPFEIAPAGVIAYEPAIAASGSGVEVMYVRMDDLIPRLFARTLDRLSAIPRGRAAGH